MRGGHIDRVYLTIDDIVCEERRDMTQVVDIASDQNLSRETVGLLVELKRHLQQHGVTIELTEPDVISRVLQAAESIGDAAVQRCYKRLLGLTPKETSPQRVYLFSTSIGRVTCGQCRNVLSVKVHPRSGVSNPQTVKCPCGQHLYIGKQARQYARKPTQLAGAYALQRDDNIIGDIVVNNISYEGLGMRLLSPSDEIRRDDVLLVQFVLDNKCQTHVCEPVDVRYIQQDMVGVKFQNAYGVSKPMIEYLRA